LLEKLDVDFLQECQRLCQPLKTYNHPEYVGDSAGPVHRVSLDCSDCIEAIRYEADNTARCFVSTGCLTMSTKTGLRISLQRHSDSCKTLLESFVVIVPVPTSRPLYHVQEAESECDQCTTNSRRFTLDATISPCACQMEEQSQGNTWAKA